MTATPSQVHLSVMTDGKLRYWHRLHTDRIARTQARMATVDDSTTSGNWAAEQRDGWLTSIQHSERALVDINGELQRRGLEP